MSTSTSTDAVALAERATLGAALESRAAYERVAKILDGSAFAEPRHEIIWDAITWVNEQGTPEDPATADEVLVAMRLHQLGQLDQVGGALYLDDLVATAVLPSNAAFYARQVKQAAKARALSVLGTRLQQAGKTVASATEQDEVISSALEHLEQIGADSDQEDPTAPLASEMSATMDILEGGGRRSISTGLEDLDDVLGGLAPGQLVVVAARPGVGKALALDTPIPTPTGWTTMGALRVGDRVLGKDGAPTTVVAATDVMHEHTVYRVEFTDGTHILADAEHLWLTATRDAPLDFQVRTTTDIINSMWTADGRLPAHFVPPVAPMDLPEVALPADPYEVGRHFAGARTASSPHPVVGETIPAQYLRASKAQRAALLEGILDAAGYPSVRGQIVVHAPGDLNRIVAELVRSLGYLATTAGTTVTFDAHDNPFRSRDLAESFTPAPPRRRYITAITPVQSVPVRCIQVDNTDHVYLAGPGWTPTHNTVMALALAEHVAMKQRRPVLGFSLEMSRMEMLTRLLSMVCRINSRSLNLSRPKLTEQDWIKIAERMDDITNAPLHICDDPSITPARISALIGAFKRKHPDLGMVFVDYLQLMNGEGNSRQEVVAAMTRALKLAAKRHGVPIVLLSQLNRNSESRTDKKPQVADLRESGAIEQDADVVILLHREDAYDPESERAGEMDLDVAKNRGGPTRNVTVAAQMHYYRLTNLSRAAEPGQGGTPSW